MQKVLLPTVIIDWLMLHTHLIPITMSVTAKGIAWLFLKEVIRLHRVPDSIISNQDTKFTSIFWHELQQLMEMKLLMSTAFHLQDGATEQANCLIGNILCSVVRDDQKDWAVKCLMVKVALNSSISATTGFAPFMLNHGYMMWINLPMATNIPFESVPICTTGTLEPNVHTWCYH